MITLTATDDMGLVKEIAGHQDIWDRFSDGVKREDYEPDNSGRTQWLVIHSGDEVAGVIMVFCETTCAIGFHPYMYKKYRCYAREMIKAFFNWFIEVIPESVCKINVEIPDCYMSTVNVAKKTGFKHEGVNRDSYRRNGKVYNQIMSGITRKEVEQCLA
tara:strand:+ start:27726 stop:28202 length:477 start_codon:yes stop_codon:yes gene_type:complete